MLLSTKGTEYESNSQRSLTRCKINKCCCCLPKVLNMKAIHNSASFCDLLHPVVVVYQRYWIWKQFTTIFIFGVCKHLLLLSTKGTEYESNSQLDKYRDPEGKVVVVYQRYWIWKQFTTLKKSPFSLICCCCLPKVLNMKAIHNWQQFYLVRFWVVVVYQRYWIWKQFTTSYQRIF